MMIKGCLVLIFWGPWQAYIRPDEELIESLTVRELLYYSALSQLPSGLPLSKKLSRVDASISEMDLEDLVSVRIGCSHETGGLSQVERKRLSLAVHMLSCPYLLFLEEPTYGLDR
jgi:ABC-type multidrug transport system ATPase subunit